jgi:hypothetical protein
VLTPCLGRDQAVLRMLALCSVQSDHCSRPQTKTELAKEKINPEYIGPKQESCLLAKQLFKQAIYAPKGRDLGDITPKQIIYSPTALALARPHGKCILGAPDLRAIELTCFECAITHYSLGPLSRRD